jgi:hypothetical protein
MIEPEIAFADLSDNASLAEGLLKYTFAALLNERQEDLAFFDERIEKGLVAKLEGIVGSEFAHHRRINLKSRGEYAPEGRPPGRIIQASVLGANGTRVSHQRISDESPRPGSLSVGETITPCAACLVWRR